jgi:putative membrane protein
MIGLLVRFVVSALALGLTSRLVHGFHTEGLWGLVQAAFILGLLNALIRPLILLLTLPVNLLTLGLFTFVINAAMLGLTARLVPDSRFRIDGIKPALMGAVVLAVVSGLLNWLVKDARERKH